MERLTPDEIKSLQQLLEKRGLTFKPLLDEMTDHVICDVEACMATGRSFEEALHDVLKDIPANHFQLIQSETMSTIERRFTFSRVVSYFALMLIFVSFFFKAMHLQFSDELLLMAFGSIAVALIGSTLTGIYQGREKEGAIRVMSVVIGIVLQLTGYVFKILHLPGADSILLIAVLGLMISLLFNTWYVYRNSTEGKNLLTHLHERYTPGINRFLVILLFPVVIYKLYVLLTGTGDLYSVLILLLVIFGTGLHFFALLWRSMERNASVRTPVILIALAGTILFFMTPYLAPYLSQEIRYACVVMFTCISAWLTFRMEEGSIPKFPAAMVILSPLLFLCWALIHNGLFPTAFNRIIFNPFGILLFATAIFFTRNQLIVRTFLILQLSAYMFEYIR